MGIDDLFPAIDGPNAIALVVRIAYRNVAACF